MSPSAAFASATAASSPETMITGTPNRPAKAPANAASEICLPLSRTSVRRALENVCARTPAGLLVLAW